MKYSATANLRQQKQLMINTMRDAMLVRGYTSVELSKMTDVGVDNIRKYLRDMAFGNQRAYVSTWTKDRAGKWHAVYMYGTKPDMPRPPKLEATIERQLRRDRRASNSAEEAAARRQKAAEEARRNYAARQERKEMWAERAERAAAFARIKPRMDPWAHLFHGGAAVLGGVAA